MTDEQIISADMVLRALDQAIADLADAALQPEAVEYLARNWELVRDSERRFMDAKNQIVRRALKLRVVA